MSGLTLFPGLIDFGRDIGARHIFGRHRVHRQYYFTREKIAELAPASSHHQAVYELTGEDGERVVRRTLSIDRAPPYGRLDEFQRARYYPSYRRWLKSNHQSTSSSPPESAWKERSRYKLTSFTNNRSLFVTGKRIRRAWVLKICQAGRRGLCPSSAATCRIYFTSDDRGQANTPCWAKSTSPRHHGRGGLCSRGW